MTRYVALLRGINVGGNNLIRMADLKACFEAGGYARVATYIQSGNVLFDAESAGASVLTQRIEAMLTERFDYRAKVVLRSRDEMRTVVAGAPQGFGTESAEVRYDVLFLKAPLTAEAALAQVPAREGVDRIAAGPGVLYYSRLIREASKSRLSKVAALPIYQSMTIRNWNTTTRLLQLLQADGAAAS